MRSESTKAIPLRPHLEAFKESLVGRERSRFQSALTHLLLFLGDEVVLPNRSLLFDIPRRLRHLLREEGCAVEAIKSYSYWTTKALRWSVDNVEELRGIQKLTHFPHLNPDPDDEQKRFWKGYHRFVLWCAKHDISLEQLQKKVFRDYQSHLLANHTYETARSYYSALVSFWEVRSNRWDLPLLDIPSMERKGKPHYGLHRSSWPTQVQADFDLFLKFSRRQISLPDRPTPNFRDEASEIGFTTVLSTYFGYLANIRMIDISRSGLRELIANEEHVLEYIAWHKAERGEGRDLNAHRRTLEHFAILLDELWSDPVAVVYREFAAQLDPVRKEPRFEKMLIPFQDLLKGAVEALKDATRDCRNAERLPTPKRLRDAAVGIHDALLFATMIFRPLREANIIELAEGQSLLRKADGKWEILIRSANEKGKKTFRIAYPSSLIPYLEEFLSKWRPLLNLKGAKHLFMTSKGGQLTPKLLGDRTSRLGQKYLGISKLNPHAFRALTVSSYLAEYPNQFEMARQLLGHKRLATTLRYYIHIHALHASRRASQFARDTCPEFCKLGELFQIH